MAETNKHHDPDARPGILRNLRIKRVALVDMGANFDKATGDGAHIMLFKSARAKSSPPVGDVHVDAPLGSEPDKKKKDKEVAKLRHLVQPDHPDYDQYETDYEKSNLDADSRNKLPDSAFAAVWTDAKGKKHRKLPIHDAGHLTAARGRVDGAKIPSNVKAEARRKIEAATRRTHNKEKRKMKDILKRLVGLLKEDDATKRASGLTEVEGLIEKAADDDDADDKVHKADDPMCKCDSCVSMRAPVPPQLAKRFTDLEKSNTDLRQKLEKANSEAAEAVAIAKAERQARATSEMVTLLKSFKATPLVLEGEKSDVPRFLKMKAADPEGFERTIELMKAQDAALAKSALFTSIGTGREGVGEGSAWAQIEAKADAMVEKGDGKLTREQAIEKVMFDPRNNKLVKQYRDEQHVQ